MKKTIVYLMLFIALVFTSTGAYAQIDVDKVCRIENGQLIFTLNLQWKENEKKEVAETFDLDSALIARVYKGETNISINNEQWKVRKLSGNRVELSKPVEDKTETKLGISDLFQVIDNWINAGWNENKTTSGFGANDFTSSKAFIYQNGVARFFLPGFNTAGKVYISGTFNNWSPSQTLMKFTGSGWSADLKLSPGRYEYKYIVDGRWMTDPENNLKERNDAGSNNSVVYCYNHVFRLKGYPNAGKVVVTGNFYEWNPRGWPMKQTSGEWSLPVYLSDGTYAYKFIVDGKWMTDPANPVVRTDADGNENSFLSIGKPYMFTLKGYVSAKKVILTGSFNNWNENELVMDKTPTGWQLPYVIGPGIYEYKFITDGKWMIDPENPFTTGKGNYTNSVMVLNPNHIFELQNHQNAVNVVVTGSFNNWNPEGYRMIKENGKWIFPMVLKPGKYLYKFIVDGEWIVDPANTLFEQNRQGTYNSILWINEPDQ